MLSFPSETAHDFRGSIYKFYPADLYLLLLTVYKDVYNRAYHTTLWCSLYTSPYLCGDLVDKWLNVE